MAAVRARRQSRGGKEPPRRYVPPPPTRGVPRLAAIKMNGAFAGVDAPKVTKRGLGGVLASAVLLCGTAMAGATWIGGSLFDAREAFALGGDALATQAGFAVRDIKVDGVAGARAEEIREMVMPPQRGSLLSAEPEDVKARVESLDWVESAHVRRLWPSTVQIEVARRRAVARWQENGAVTLIDVAGERVMAERAADRRDLPLVVGRGAGPASADVLRALEEAPELRRRTRALVRIADRRWNIELKTGIAIALPEHGADAAIAQLETLQAEYALLDRPLSRIDLRAQGRIAVSVHPQLAGGVYDWARGA
ncbi:MAG: FtsQ-type POTRA domain-containing protein [Alphaproteobacteria bacterium]|nr:FtsQ-type POTRA domain-containing protein [Alphaproteobacteria bacterium]